MTPEAISTVLMSGVKHDDVKDNKTGAKKSKTVIKLKLTGPNPNIEQDGLNEKKVKKLKKKRPEGIKKKKNKERRDLQDETGTRVKKQKGNLKLEKFANKNEKDEIAESNFASGKLFSR